MNTSRWSKQGLTYIGITILAVLFLLMLWAGFNGIDGSEICAGLGLLLAAGALLYLKQMENVSITSVAQRIHTEYPSEIQPQVLEVYNHLKEKELDGLFPKILDDAHGDVNQVKKLGALAESIGWKAFLENKW